MRARQKTTLFILGLLLALAPCAVGQKITGTIQADQYELSYITEGQGPNALVIGSAQYYARAFSENLRNHLRLTFLDHRGFAPSPGKVDSTDYSLDQIIDDMERARVALDLGKIIVIGHSGHSFMALEYAKAFPEHVSHVVMIGTAPDFGPENAALIERTWKESVDPERKRILEERRAELPDKQILKLPKIDQMVAFYVRDSPMIWYDADFDSSPLWNDVRLDPAMADYMWGRVFRDIDITRNIEKLQSPVLVALGRYDYLVAPPFTWEPYRATIPNMTIRVFEKSGHTPQYEEQEAFDSVLLQWIVSNE